MIRHKGAFLGKRANSDLIDIRAKERTFLGFTLFACIHRPESSYSKEFDMI